MSISSLQRVRSSFWGEQSRDSRMATSQWSSLRSSLMSCSRSFKSRAKSQPQDSDFKLSQKIKRLNVTKSFIKNSGQLLEDFFGWLSSRMTSSTRSRSSQDPSSTRKIRTSKISFICSSMSFRQETSSLSWSLSSQSGSRRQVPRSDSQLFRFRLGRLSKINEVNEWFIGFSIQCQSSINQQNSGFTCSFISRKRALRNDSSSSG